MQPFTFNVAEHYFDGSSAAAAATAVSHVGYWWPHSSSIDFCEPNYQWSPLVVEPHNAWSSLWGLSLVGYLGLTRGNPTGERRFRVAYSLLLAIGIGSAALHGTLHWIFQSSDELPMIYLAIAVLYCCLETDSRSSRRRSKSEQQGAGNATAVYRYRWLPHGLVALAVINTCIYYRFQTMYVVFLGTFASMIVALMVLHIRLAWRERRILVLDNHSNSISNHTTTNLIRPTPAHTAVPAFCRANNARIALKFYIWHYIVFVGIATPIWIIDQLFCTTMLPYYTSDKLPYFLQGCTLHIVWHATAGSGAHTMVQFLVACRMSRLERPCALRWILWVLPVVVDADEDGPATSESMSTTAVEVGTTKSYQHRQDKMR